jgi:hypothetical protein
VTETVSQELQVAAATTALANKVGGDPLHAETVKETVNKRVEQYITLRDQIKKMNDEHEAKLKPFVEVQNMLTGWMQNFLEQAGADSIKTAHGTCYSTTRYTASLADPEAFMAFVKQNDMYELLDRKANVTAVKDYVNEKGALPPGVNLSSIKTVGVRRASGK